MSPGLPQATHIRKQRDIGMVTQRCLGRGGKRGGASDRGPAFLPRHKQPTAHPGTAECLLQLVWRDTVFRWSFTLPEPLTCAHTFMHTAPSHMSFLFSVALFCIPTSSHKLSTPMISHTILSQKTLVYTAFHNLLCTGTQLDTGFYNIRQGLMHLMVSFI